MFDYIVIGGGSAGSVLAGRLTEDPSVRVCLLEAGPADQSVFIHCPAGLAVMAKFELNGWGQNTTPQPGLNGRQGYQPRGKVLGGSSSINAMVYVRGQHADYDHWAAQGNPGWAWNDVRPYFLRAEHNERLRDEWHGQGGPLNVADLRAPNRFSQLFTEAAVQAGFPHNTDFNGATQEGVGIYQVTHKNGERHSVAKGYLTPHLGRPNLQVITQAHATRVLLQGRRAVGVEYSQGGQLHQLRAAREVLLSAGALLSPQLLMLSGIGPGAQLQRHGIAVQHELSGVGEHLHDHPDVVQVMDAPGVTDLFGLSPRGMVNVARGMREWRRARTGMLTTNFAEAGGFIKSDPSEPAPDLQLHFVIGKLLDHGRKTVLGHGYSSHVCLLQPRSRGTVSLASNDPLQLPLVDPQFLRDPDDMVRMVRGVRRMRTILSQPALAQFGAREQAASAHAQTDAQIEQFIRQYADTIYHPVGTCRMGPGTLDVVDAQLRVHGMQGLRVVDASIMPRIVSGNTNAPVVMIAEKAVDLLRAAA
ncbi:MULTISPECIES: GMC family oxidoreductase [unclassified Acidovorax]|uniref:GMC family oxidoreductase n=1 Tax=unclassified Acidovorax TaxID=2684926 RepID=UPI000B40056C|nr:MULTISPECIES: GMC family oxidoreductase N-terminal domain-containing protein [unclassified Acidovorax]